MIILKRLLELLKLKLEGSLTYTQTLELRDLLRDELDEVKVLSKSRPKKPNGLSSCELSRTNYTKIIRYY